jgi:tetrahydromethanopterin S-methyltransferase subunit G
VARSNTPTAQEIDLFVRSQADQIDAHFSENQRQYRIPKRVVVDTLTPSKESGTDALEAAFESWKGGTGRAEVAQRFGYRVQRDVAMLRGENKKAFVSKRGALGIERDGPRGTYLWKVNGFIPSAAAKLDRPLRREIAAELLRTRKLTGSAKAALEKAKESLMKFPKAATEDEISRLRKEVDALDVKVTVTELFPRTTNGFIPALGLAKPVVDDAFERSLKDPVAGPFFDRQTGYVYRLLEHQKPVKAAFNKKLATERSEWVDRYFKRSIGQGFVEAAFAKLPPNIDLRPLRVKYGVVKKRR